MDLGTIVAAGIAFLSSTGLAAMVVTYLKQKIEVVAQKLEASKAIQKLNQSNGQGDSLASMGIKMGGAVVSEAATIPTLKPFVDKLNVIYNDGVKIWNDESGTDAQMNDIVSAFNDVHAFIQKMLPPKAVPSA